jgi:hypothetical protein
MEAPAVTRRRRPFLAPLWVIVLAGFALLGVAWSFYRTAGSTLIVLVRCPDKPPGAIADPPISPDGEARAQSLARVFGAARGPGGLDAIYVSEDRRAQQAVAPLAERLHRVPVTFPAAEIRSVGARVLREHHGGTVLIVADAAGVAQIEQALGVEQGGVPSEPDVINLLSIPSFGPTRLLRISF